MNKEIIKILDNDEDTKWNILLVAVLIVVLLGALFSNGTTDKKAVALIQRVLKFYFTRKLFTTANFEKNYTQKFSIDSEDFINAIKKLSRRQKLSIAKFLKEKVSEINVSFLLDGDLQAYRHTVKNLSYLDKNELENCKCKIDTLLIINDITCEIICFMADDGYVPKKSTIINFIDFANLVEAPDNELLRQKEMLIDYTKLDEEMLQYSSVKIVECLKNLLQKEQFSQLLDSYLFAKKIDLLQFPMPPEFDNDKLANLYITLADKKYIENGKKEYFVQLFNDGISSDMHFTWQTKHRYEFNYFVFELYRTTFQKIEKTVEANVSKIFFDKKRKPLSIYNYGNSDYTDDRNRIREKIAKIISDCRNGL